MTLNTEQVETPARRPDPPAGRARAAAPPVRWYRRPWIIPLALVIGVYLYIQLKPFVNLDRTTAPVPPQDATTPYYYVLLAHITFGTLAILTVPLQLWQWFRRRYPAVHRSLGRVYVGCVAIAAPCGLTIVRFAPPVGQIGVSMAASLWLIFTVIAFVAIRRRQYPRHRKFMLYSIAMMLNNIWGIAMVEIGTRLPVQIDFTYYLEGARWIGWVVNLMLVQIWLDRTRRRPLRIPGYDLPARA